MGTIGNALSRRSFIAGSLSMAACIAAAGTPALSFASEGRPYDESTDVVVVGAGGAGLTAAIKSREAGLKVIVLEKESHVGGDTLYASTSFTCASAQVQRDAGVEGDTPEALFELYKGRTDPAYVSDEALKLLADRSAEAADFLTSIGMDLSRCWATFSCSTADGSAPGPLEVEVLSQRAAELGAEVRVESLVSQIARNANGAIEGVVVETPEGSYAIEAPVVVLASGGYAANNALVTEYDPRWEGLAFSCGPQATGEGMIAAIETGAAVSHMDDVRVNPATYALTETVRVSLTPITSNGAIVVATNASEQNSGKRILNEEASKTVNALANIENGGWVYLVFDQSIIDKVAAVAGFKEAGYLIEGATLEELADQMDVDKDAFLETCATWTEYASNGEDPDFGKKNFPCDLTVPPFYAVLSSPALQGTNGGVSVDIATTAVLDEGGAVIPGFFACGECADNQVSGQAPTCENIVFGTISAESAAAYLA